MNATIELDVLSLVLLLFAIILASRSRKSKMSNRWYMFSALTLLFVIGTELFAYQVDDFGVASQIAAHRITNVLGFGLSPFVCYFLFRYIAYSKYRRESYWLFVPLSANALLSILSYHTGWYFFVDEMNVYHRGLLFPLATAHMLFYYGLCILFMVKTLRTFEVSDRPFMMLILVTPIVGAAIQIVFPPVLTLWPGIAISLLLFYLFSQEQYYAFDVLTGLRNRSTFMRDLSDKQRLCKTPASIVVCDINDLKKTNDTYGHAKGDALLLDASILLERCFRGIGKVYRIGGDEFAVIATGEDPFVVEKGLSLFSSQLALLNKSRKIPLSLAFGWSWCESCQGNIFNTYIASDNSMYANKKSMKEGRR
ncbi:MAG: GGDEF domain-containing protein [Sphaerochaeta sp.]